MFTRLHLGSLSLRPAPLLCGNLRPLVTKTPLPHATEVYGQLLRRDFNPLDLLLLLRTARLDFKGCYAASGAAGSGRVGAGRLGGRGFCRRSGAGFFGVGTPKICS